MLWKLSKISAFWISCYIFVALIYFFTLLLFVVLSHLIGVWLRRSFCLSRQGFSVVYYQLTFSLYYFSIIIATIQFSSYCLFAVTLTNLYLLIESTLFSVKLFQALNFRLILFKDFLNLVNFVFNSVPLLTFCSVVLLWLYNTIALKKCQ